MSKKEIILEKIKEKESIDLKLEEITKQVEDFEKKGIHKNQVDSEGFPRADLDFGNLITYKNLKRTQREMINDQRKLYKEIEEGLYTLHSQYKIENPVEEGEFVEINKTTDNKKAIELIKKNEENKMYKEDNEENNIKNVKKQNSAIPFLRIGEIFDESPAKLAG